MRHINIARNRSHFKNHGSWRIVQAAMMTLRPGQSSSDEPDSGGLGEIRKIELIIVEHFASPV
jgi:hypothetical protein